MVKVRRLAIKQDFFTLIRPLLKKNGTVLLESSGDYGELGRYSILAVEPERRLQTTGRNGTLISASGARSFTDDPFAALQKELRQHPAEPDETGLPFSGGAFCCFGYDLGRQIERLPARLSAPDSFPEMLVGFYDKAYVYDNVLKELHGVISGADSEHERELDSLEAALLSLGTGQSPVAFKASDMKSNFTRESYCTAVARALDYIKNGDIYQVNLSQAFEFNYSGDPCELYENLRQVSPAPFSAFLNFDSRFVLSSSPERFVKLTGRHIETRPIKGTRPRGATPEADAAMAQELLDSQKDRAELTMIVDLERNDLGRVAKTGSVRVTANPSLETYAQVHHLTGVVEAELDDRFDAVDLLRASFPGGSITGAPKIRAMEIIEELEPVRRSLYTGALGYIGFNGNMDTNILIRSLYLDRGKGRFQVGGGIVADSVPELEYEETLHKAQGILKALRIS